MPKYDIVIKQGTIIDGTRVPRYRADGAIVDGVVAEIGHIKAEEGARVV